MKTYYLYLCTALMFVGYGCEEKAPEPFKNPQTVTIEEVREYLDENPVYDLPGNGKPDKLQPARQLPVQLTPDWDKTESIPCTKGKGHILVVYLGLPEQTTGWKMLKFTKQNGKLKVVMSM